MVKQMVFCVGSQGALPPEPPKLLLSFAPGCRGKTKTKRADLAARPIVCLVRGDLNLAYRQCQALPALAWMQLISATGTRFSACSRSIEINREKSRSSRQPSRMLQSRQGRRCSYPVRLVDQTIPPVPVVVKVHPGADDGKGLGGRRGAKPPRLATHEASVKGGNQKWTVVNGFSWLKSRRSAPY